MFIDEITISAKAGRGGDGVVRWRKEIFEPMGGPAGGNGGRGGAVLARATRNSKTLNYYRQKNSFEAENGEAGGSRSKHGASAPDLILEFPIGTVITNKSTGEIFHLLKESQTERLLTGGAGGLGNEHFKSSTNTTPYEYTEGRDGEEASFFVELELFADIGLIGLPNAGKSSLLNALTNAKAKVGDYAFTTLDPNLGAYSGYTFADIPGLIEGAHEGKGLGTKFLRHIKHTKMLAHLISFENFLTCGAKGIENAYKEIRGELKAYGHGLSEKEEIVLLSKSDLVDEKIVERELKKFKTKKIEAHAITLFEDKDVKECADAMIKRLKKL